MNNRTPLVDSAIYQPIPFFFALPGCSEAQRRSLACLTEKLQEAIRKKKKSSIDMDDRNSISVDYERGISLNDGRSHGDAAINTAPMGSPPKSALPPSARPYWEMSDLTKKLIYIEVASVVIAVMTGMRLGRYATDLQKYAFSVAVVSLAVTVWVRKQDRDNRKILDEEAGTFADGSKITKEYLVGVFLCLWWFVGALIMTFVGPYTITSNGYFAAWLGCWGSIMWTAPFLVEATGQRAAGLTGRYRYLVGIVAASIVLIIASIEWLHSAEGVFALTLGGLSVAIIAVLVIIYDKLHKELLRGIAALLAVLWMFGAGILTFRGPFLMTGNGFFSSWLGLFCSLHYCSMEFRNEEYIN